MVYTRCARISIQFNKVRKRAACSIRWASVPAAGQNVEFQSVETAENKRKKREAKVKFHWQNLNLYGPLQHRLSGKKTGPKAQCASKRPKNNEVVANLEDDLEKGLLTANLDILGNKSHAGMPIIKNHLPSERIILDKKVLQSLISSNDAEHDPELHFPLFGYLDYSVGELNQCARNILNIDVQQLEMENQLPAVAAIMEMVTPKEERQKLVQDKMNFIKNYGVDYFYACQEEAFEIQTRLHENIQTYFQGTPLGKVKTDPVSCKYWASLFETLKKISEVSLMRSKVLHPNLKYSGLIDYVGKYRNGSSLIELFVPSPGIPSANKFVNLPLTAAAHLGIYNALNEQQVENILIIVANGHGQPADTILMARDSCFKCWVAWLNKLQTYWHLRKLYPLNNYINIESK